MSEVIAERYRLVEALGEGGMGRVWQARDELLGRDVALKELVLPRGLPEAEIRDLRERAIREARAIARVSHPHVVRIYDVIHDGGSPWIVMELVIGRSLFEAVRDDGAMPPERVAGIGLDILAALRAAHRAGVLHRDVKPANVLLSDDGRVVLTDFGLAATTGDSGMTSTGIVLGSPSYLAPERALDEEITAASDLWSLGATLYAAVEGRPPYDKSSPMATLAALATQPPRPPEQAGVMQPVLAGLLRKEPAERIGADEAEELLRAAAGGVAGVLTPLPAKPTVVKQVETVEVPAPRKPSRNRVAWWVGSAAVLLLAAVIAGRPVLSDAGAEEVAAPPSAGVGAGVEQQSSDPGSPAPSVPVPSGSAPLSAPSATNAPGVTATTALAVAPTATTANPATTTTTTAAGAAEQPAAAVGSPVQNMQTGTCLQMDTGSGAIIMWTCNGTDAQKFDVRSDGSLRVMGRCVRILGNGNGGRVGTGACDGSTAAQWDLNSSFDLVNLEVVKCADVPDGSSADGVALQVWECSGTGNQKWRH
ncbi:serine/threonine protein kinase [Actinoplanes tereljensis]|uniref:serine/threonine protein kinase n=1 Tax=Paractinoplanes tereljensis TaxID=571912 RepID=UPI001EF2D629|nr:serine/threonine protein kinase [Actinoplanes tereljensis]